MTLLSSSGPRVCGLMYRKKRTGSAVDARGDHWVEFVATVFAQQCFGRVGFDVVVDQRGVDPNEGAVLGRLPGLEAAVGNAGRPVTVVAGLEDDLVVGIVHRAARTEL